MHLRTGFELYYTSKIAGERRLHYSESLEADLAPIHAGKVMESVIAERISYLVETFGLLPTNHSGARKRRSAEQALMLLQEQIYAA